MIVEAGQLALVLALFASVYAAGASVLGAARRSSELLASGRFAFYSSLPLLFVATGALIYAFVTNESIGSVPGTLDVIDLETLEVVGSAELAHQSGGIDFWKGPSG